MNGFLMQQKTIVLGDEVFVESHSPENEYGIVFESNDETGYFYAVEIDAQTKQKRILDALHIFETPEISKMKKQIDIKIIWARDWMKCALIVDDECHAVFDFEKNGGYNINEFPPPNTCWTKQERKLTDAMIQQIF
jgi:hypothetical protein